MERSGLPALDEHGEAPCGRRRAPPAALLSECGGPPAVFINVGGSLTSIGGCRRPDGCRPGCCPRDPGGRPGCGLIYRMAADGVPVIHLLNVLGLARDHGLPADPVPLPRLPDGRVMTPGGYSRTVARTAWSSSACWAAWSGCEIRKISIANGYRADVKLPRRHW